MKSIFAKNIGYMDLLNYTCAYECKIIKKKFSVYFTPIHIIRNNLF